MNTPSKQKYAGFPGQSAVGKILLVCMLLGIMSGCAGVSIEDMVNLAGAVAKSFEDFTPEQEYYIGRTVGAMIVNKYPPYDQSVANTYLNILGQTLAQASDRPETFKGYRFLILDTDEINAFAAPGGLIFISRGLLRCGKTEDAVAAVLAHEIGHVQQKHGLQAIKKSRITAALTSAAIVGIKAHGDKDLVALTETFGNSIADITNTLITNGYSRSFEKEADLAAVTILQRVGYDPNGMVDMLTVMKTKLQPGGLDFAKTHPSPDSRIADIQEKIGAYAAVKPSAIRQKRLTVALGNI
jgi:predicted Zn-dependent protease